MQIGEKSLDDIRAALGEEKTATAAPISRNGTRTILAGLSLFLALSFAGVWLARSTASKNQKVTAAGVLVAALLSSAAVITRGNAGPPPSYFWRNLAQNLEQGKSTSGGVTIEVLPGEEGVKLIMPLKPKTKRND